MLAFFYTFVLILSFVCFSCCLVLLVCLRSVDEEQGDCHVMEYPTKFNKYRRLKEREALSKSPSKDGFASMSNGFPMPNSMQMSNITLIPNTCSMLTTNCTLTPVETRM